MKKIQDTPTHEIFLDYFQGEQVRVLKDKATGQVSFNADDVAKVLGYKDHSDMMKDPKVIQTLASHHAETGKSAITTIDNTILN